VGLLHCSKTLSKLNTCCKPSIRFMNMVRQGKARRSCRAHRVSRWFLACTELPAGIATPCIAAKLKLPPKAKPHSAHANCLFAYSLRLPHFQCGPGSGRSEGRTQACCSYCTANDWATRCSTLAAFSLQLLPSPLPQLKLALRMYSFLQWDNQLHLNSSILQKQLQSQRRHPWPAWLQCKERTATAETQAGAPVCA
jgi:hypothetical protein